MANNDRRDFVLVEVLPSGAVMTIGLWHFLLGPSKLSAAPISKLFRFVPQRAVTPSAMVLPVCVRSVKYLEILHQSSEVP